MIEVSHFNVLSLRSHTDKTILLVKLGERYVPIAESAVVLLPEEKEESEKEEDKTEPEVDLPRRTYKELYIEHLINKPTETSKPFSLLLKAINNENATEFELPKAINLSEVFPYSWKWSTDEKRRSVETECERGTHIMCYVCCKTSRAGPMVTCDFCPLSFHLDCPVRTCLALCLTRHWRRPTGPSWQRKPARPLGTNTWSFPWKIFLQ